MLLRAELGPAPGESAATARGAKEEPSEESSFVTSAFFGLFWLKHGKQIGWVKSFLTSTGVFVVGPKHGEKRLNEGEQKSGPPKRCQELCRVAVRSSSALVNRAVAQASEVPGGGWTHLSALLGKCVFPQKPARS